MFVDQRKKVCGILKGSNDDLVAQQCVTTGIILNYKTHNYLIALL
jgi:hypothetical protein